MNHDKDAATYLRTGILGSYETARCLDEAELDGKYAPCFDDSLLIFDSDSIRRTRHMMVEGKVFRVTSIFPSAGASTPTDRMLRLIDTDLEKETRRDGKQ